MSPRAVCAFGLVLLLACQPDVVHAPQPNRSPTAAIAAPNAGIEGTPIEFSAQSSSDPDGDSLSYAWTFADGQRSAGALVGHAFRNDGSYQVTLIVEDSHGASDTARTTVTVANAAPIITALTIPSTPVPLGTPAIVHVAFSDPGTLDLLTASVDWGDEWSSPIVNGSASYSYRAVGNYTVTVTVRDDDGGITQQTASTALVVGPHPQNRPPVAQLRGPSTAREGEAVRFYANESIDPEGGPLKYSWDLGTGTRSPFGLGPSENGFGPPDNGIYTISVIVADTGGAADTASTTLTVANAPPVLSGMLLPPQQAAGVPATTRISFSDSGSADTHVITVTWGDGTRDSVLEASDAYRDTLIHVYAARGSYRIQATIRDKDGAIDSASAELHVFDATERRTIAGYDVFDLGTLGGNSARPQDFNDHGQIVGSSLTASGNYEAFVWDNGTLRALGTLGHLNSEAQKINNAGAIAGVVWSEEPGYSQYEVWMPATWRDGAGALIPNSSFDEDQPATAMAINEAGDIVWSAHGHEDPYIWLWRRSEWHRLGSLLHPLGVGRGTAINERGQIVGGTAAVDTPDSPWSAWHAFLWDGVMRDLGLLGVNPCPGDPDVNCGRAGASGINESGQVVGFSTAADGSYHAVLWADGTIKDLWAVPPVLGWYNPFAVVNDRGYVAGSAYGEAFVWRDGALRALGSLGGGGTEVVDMNEAGMVVGTSMTAAGEQHVFLWTPERGMVDLGTGPHGFTGAWVTGISYDGDIVGYTAPCTLNYYRACNFPREPRAVMWRRLTP
jgi:probable HAF family extracellular repeat protein